MTHFLPTTNSLAAHDDDHTIVVAPEDRTIVVPPRTPDDYAVALPGGRRLWVSHPLSVQDVPGLLDILLREWMSDRLTTAARTCLSNNSHRQRKPRRPTLTSVAKQASKGGIEVARYEIKPDGTVVVVIGRAGIHGARKSVARRSQGDEAMKLPKYVQAWVDRRDGRARLLFPPPWLSARVRLPGLPWSPSFMAAYEAAMSGPRTAIGAGRIKPGSVAAVVAEYFDSQQFFASKSAGTQRMRRGILERFRAAYGDRPFALLPPEWIEALLDAKPPHAARTWLVTLRSLCQFAVKRGWLRARPDAGHQAALDQGRRIPHLDRRRDRAIRGASSDRHQAAPRAGAVALHRTTAQRCRPHGPPAHPATACSR